MTEDYGLALATGTHVLANQLKAAETDAARKAKKQRVVAMKLRLLREVWPEAADALRRSRDVPRLLRRISDGLDARPYVIDLAFGNPFAPYQLRYDDNDFTARCLEGAQTRQLEETSCLRHGRSLGPRRERLAGSPGPGRRSGVGGGAFGRGGDRARTRIVGGRSARGGWLGDGRWHVAGLWR
jgi:hypothetical protein